MTQTLADFYDAIHTELTDDIPVILNLAQMAEGPVLELGCGTGRVLKPLIDAGVTVTGVDNDATMLDRVRPFVIPPSTLILQDFTHLSLDGQTYKLIVISHNTLMHVPFDQLNSLFSGIARHLDENGLLFIDTANPFILTHVEDSPEWELEREWADEDDETNVIRQFSRFTADHAVQQIRVDWRFDRSNQPDQPVHSETIYHYHMPHVLQQMMKTHRLIWEMTYGNYAGDFFDQESDDLLIIARKRPLLA